MIAIIAAMDLEVAYIKEKMTNVVTRKIMKTEFFVGNLAKKVIVLVKCGIGKVMSSHTTTLLVEHFKPSLIINIGVAGGILEEANVLDLVISDKVGYYDVDITHFGDLAYGQMANMPTHFQTNQEFVSKATDVAKKLKIPYHIGDILSGDSFVTNESYMKQLIENHFDKWNIVAVDMESVSIAQVAYILSVPCLILRALSDKVGATSQAMLYQDFVNQAAMNASLVVEEFIKEIPYL
ncbi:MAG TPA: 5'-methylthioadenosine/adenosylhomocysteine nucleosidase [Bacilli bacterium]|nr:5'-methylthioadenosine/adenosylhomocysteine nucleosidase [Bacilli bacterium]